MKKGTLKTVFTTSVQAVICTAAIAAGVYAFCLALEAGIEGNKKPKAFVLQKSKLVIR